jgi:hypothetical protein
MVNPLLHDENGKFKKGNRAGGRIPIAKGGKPNDPHGLRKIIMEDAHKIVRAMIKEAEAGDVNAADKLLSYCMPKLSAVALKGDEHGQLPIMKIIMNAEAAKTVDIEGKPLSGEIIDADEIIDD